MDYTLSLEDGSVDSFLDIQTRSMTLWQDSQVISDILDFPRPPLHDADDELSITWSLT